MRAISREHYLSAYRSQLPISIAQMALATSLALASVAFHDNIALLCILAAACLATRLRRWLYIRPKIAGRLADAGKPKWLLVVSDISFTWGLGILGAAILMNWLWRGGWNGLLGTFIIMIVAGLPFTAFNRYLRAALRADSIR